LRDAVALETRGVPAVVLANDVFKPMMYGTAELLGLRSSYVDSHVIFFPHPTSNLTREQIFALVDARSDEILAAIEGTRGSAGRNGNGAADLQNITALLAPLQRSLHEDGADLTIEALRDGTLQTTLVVGDACEDGACVLPRAQLVAMIEAMLRDKFSDALTVAMKDSRER
jgi:hypothetical protein